jgi:hypothetical protein
MPMKIFRFIISLFFLIIVWCFFIAGREFLLTKPIENLYHVPSEATFAMRIDGTTVLKSAAFSIILEANDPDLIDVVNRQINEKRKRTGKSKSLGIDFLSDVVVYALPFEDGQIIGYTYNLNRPDLMRKNAKRGLDSNQVYVINDKIGVVLSLSGKKRLTPSQKSKMISIAQKIAFEPSKSQLADKLALRESNKIIQLSSKGQLFGETTLFNRSDMDLVLEDHGLKMSGQLFKNLLEKRVFNQPKYTLKPDGMHFYTTLIPQKIQDTIHKLLLGNGLSLPRIQAISANYRGATINNTDRNLIYSPNMDLLVTFEKDFDFKKALLESPALSAFKLKPEGDGLSNGINEFIFKKIDSKTYLISSKKDVKPISTPTNCLLCVKGQMDPITNIKGDKMILFFLENLPIFKTTKDFFSKTEGVKIEITNTEQNMAIVDGYFNFKKEYFPLNEFLKYSIQNNFIRVK